MSIQEAIKLNENNIDESINILVNAAKELIGEKGIDYQIERAVVAETAISKAIDRLDAVLK